MFIKEPDGPVAQNRVEKIVVFPSSMFWNKDVYVSCEHAESSVGRVGC